MLSYYTHTHTDGETERHRQKNKTDIEQKRKREKDKTKKPFGKFAHSFFLCSLSFVSFFILMRNLSNTKRNYNAYDITQ